MKLVARVLSVLLLAGVAQADTPVANLEVTRTKGEPLYVVAADHDGADDWVRSVKLKVKNVGSKPVRFIEYWLELPELHEGGGPLVLKLISGDPEKDKRVIEPGSEEKLKLTSDSVKLIDSKIYERVGGPPRTKSSMSMGGGLGPAPMRTVAVRLTKARLLLERVVFQDGTVWQSTH